jgi:choice-of-anchor A domain-containing protein
MSSLPTSLAVRRGAPLALSAALLVGAALPGAARAALLDLGTAGRFNVFALGSFNSAGSDTEGAVAVAGNATLSNYSVNAQNQSGQAGQVLVVGGNLNFLGGSINHGNAWVGGSSNLANLGFAGSLQQGAAPFSFSQTAQQLVGLSAALGTATANGSADFNPWGGVTLQGDGSGGPQVFNLPGARLLGVNNIMFAGLSRGQTLILNINGRQSGFQNVGLNGFADYNVLFNFVDATQLTLDGVGLYGSILAPLASLSGGNGQINGNVVVKDWSSNIQINANHLFSAADVAISLPAVTPSTSPQSSPSSQPQSSPLSQPATAVPEPGTLALLLAGVGAAALVARGRKRK